MVDFAPSTLPGFVLLAGYLRATAKLFTGEQQLTVESMLLADPEAGDLIPGTGGVRKLRVPFRRRGKRGGARVVYYFRHSVGRIYLITAYDKTKQADLAPAERRALRRLVALLEEER